MERSYSISTDPKTDVYVDAILANAIKQRDDLVAKDPAMKEIQAKIDASMENIDGFEDRLLILAAATKYMTHKR